MALPKPLPLLPLLPLPLLLLPLLVAAAAAAGSPPLSVVHAHAHGVSNIGDASPAPPTSPPTVTLPVLGTAEGKFLTTLFGKTFSAFHALPYAKYPYTRFRYTEIWDDEEWTEKPYDASRLRDRCPQGSYIASGSSGHDNCLHVSVYTPLLDLSDMTEASWKGRPVMIFIHGGSYTTGEATLYMPSKLMDRDVVVAVVQYRLGTLGFLYSGTDEAPGNAGLHDQILAIRWVHKYIQHFGGDPGLTTIFGQSAGGASTSLLMTSPLMFPDANGGEDLAHRFIPMSGSALEYWTLDSDPEEGFRKQVEGAGCQDKPDKAAMVKCMEELSLDELVHAAGKVSHEDNVAGGLGFTGQVPVVQDSPELGPGLPRVLREHPAEAVKEGRFLQAPVMTGSVRDEGSMVMGIVYGSFLKPNGYQNDSNFLEFQMLNALSQTFGIQDETYSVANAFEKSFFPDNVNLANWTQTAGPLIDLAGMLFLKSGLWTLAHRMASYDPSLPLFFYSYEYETDDSLFEFMVSAGSEVPFLGGITHADDLLYLFNLPGYFDAQEKEMVTKITTLYANFAKYGDPTPPEEDNWTQWSPRWPRFTLEGKMIHVIDREMRPEFDFATRWNYNKYGYPHQEA